MQSKDAVKPLCRTRQLGLTTLNKLVQHAKVLRLRNLAPDPFAQEDPAIHT